jgi:hypothetical protein
METTPAKTHGDMMLREVSGEITPADLHVRKLLDDYKAGVQAAGINWTGTMPYEVAAYLIEQGWTPAQ